MPTDFKSSAWQHKINGNWFHLYIWLELTADCSVFLELDLIGSVEWVNKSWFIFSFLRSFHLKFQSLLPHIWNCFNASKIKIATVIKIQRQGRLNDCSYIKASSYSPCIMKLKTFTKQVKWHNRQYFLFQFKINTGKIICLNVIESLFDQCKLNLSHFYHTHIFYVRFSIIFPYCMCLMPASDQHPCSRTPWHRWPPFLHSLPKFSTKSNWIL